MPKQNELGVKTPEECRKIARDCCALAQRSRDEAERDQWLLLAQSWELLAAERDKQNNRNNPGQG